MEGEELADIERAGLPVHRHDGEQHQHGAGEGVEEELVRRLDAPRSAPDADDQEHRDQAALEEHVEHGEVERREHADAERLEDEEHDHVVAHALLDRRPAGDNADRDQERRQHHEQHRDAVDAHAVADGRADPVVVLDELEAGIAAVEARPHPQREHEGDERDDERDPARQFLAGLAVARHEEQDQRADQRQEGDD